MGCKVAIEYAFTRRDPQRALQQEMDGRLDALERLFRLHAINAPQEEIEQQAQSSGVMPSLAKGICMP